MSTVESTFMPVPVAPRDLAESGLTSDLVTQLVLKTLHLGGTCRVWNCRRAWAFSSP